MFTSRAEMRLLLRQDNADLRLSPLAARIGLLDEERGAAASARLQAIQDGIELTRRVKVEGIALNLWLRRPENDWHNLPEDTLKLLPPDVWEPVSVEVIFAAHINRMRMEAQRIQRQEDKRIPADFDYNAVPSMKTEARQRFNRVRPTTIGQAARIPGITPADIALLLVWLKK
jgi:tRNA uridine 5-carboxymethylaminomethyl modification enzyme